MYSLTFYFIQAGQHLGSMTSGKVITLGKLDKSSDHRLSLTFLGQSAEAKCTKSLSQLLPVKTKSLQPSSILPSLLLCTSHKVLCVLPLPKPSHCCPLDMLCSITSKCFSITNLCSKLSPHVLKAGYRLLTLLSFQSFAIKVFFKNKLG